MNVSKDPVKEIFYNYYSPLCNYATSFVTDKMVAEDIVQNLFIQLWESDKLNEIESLDKFLIRATKFKCIDYLRTFKADKSLIIDDSWMLKANSPSDLKEEEIEPLLRYFAAKLPPKTREVFLKSRTESKTYKEIAESMDISVKTVETQMSRALKQMKQILKDNDFLSITFML